MKPTHALFHACSPSIGQPEMMHQWWLLLN